MRRLELVIPSLFTTRWSQLVCAWRGHRWSDGADGAVCHRCRCWRLGLD